MVYENLGISRQSSGVVTATWTSGTTITSNNHGFILGTEVKVSGTIPAALNTNTTYYVVNPSTNTFSLATSPEGTAITLSGSGTFTVTTNSLYGYLNTANNRYPSGYIDDAIAGADLSIMKTLLKSRQYHFAPDFFTVQSIPASYSVVELPVNTEMLNVRFYYNTSGSEEQGVEIPWEMFEMFTEPLSSTGTSLFSFTGEGGKKYGGYYSVKDHILWTIPFAGVPYKITSTSATFEIQSPIITSTSTIISEDHPFVSGDKVIVSTTGTFPQVPDDGGEGTLAAALNSTTVYTIEYEDLDTFRLFIPGSDYIEFGSGGTGVLTATKVQESVGYFKYISLAHQSTLTTLYSPKSFEEAIAFLASANLLMKRADNPQQATYYMQQYQTMMGIYMTPSTNQQRKIDE